MSILHSFKMVSITSYLKGVRLDVLHKSLAKETNFTLSLQQIINKRTLQSHFDHSDVLLYNRLSMKNLIGREHSLNSR